MAWECLRKLNEERTTVRIIIATDPKFPLISPRSFNESNSFLKIYACIEFILLLYVSEADKVYRLQCEAVFAVNPVNLVNIPVTTCILGNTEQRKLSLSLKYVQRRCARHMPIAIIEYEKGVAPRISGKVLLVLASKPNCSFCNTVLGIRRDRRSKDYLNPNIRTLASGGRLTRVCCDCHTANQLYQPPWTAVRATPRLSDMRSLRCVQRRPNSFDSVKTSNGDFDSEPRLLFDLELKFTNNSSRSQREGALYIVLFRAFVAANPAGGERRSGSVATIRPQISFTCSNYCAAAVPAIRNALGSA